MSGKLAGQAKRPAATKGIIIYEQMCRIASEGRNAEFGIRKMEGRKGGRGLLEVLGCVAILGWRCDGSYKLRYQL
jgi:hypothetical protein